MEIGEIPAPPGGDPDTWLSHALRCRFLSEPDIKTLCERAKDLLLEESNIVPVSSPVTVCGDIHGQYYDLMELFKVSGGKKLQDLRIDLRDPEALN